MSSNVNWVLFNTLSTVKVPFRLVLAAKPEIVKELPMARLLAAEVVIVTVVPLPAIE